MTVRRSAATVWLLIGLAAPVTAENWPQWRGPFLNGSTTETGLPETFSATEHVLWSTPMPGPSGATPAVWEEAVFVSSTDTGSGQPGALVALCLDARTGAVRWRHEVGRDQNVPRNNMASPSPATDGQRVFFLYGTGVLAAFDLAGNRLWQRDLVQDYGHPALMFGYSSSPLLHGGRLLVPLIRNRQQNSYGRATPGTVDSLVLALDPASGRELWKVVRAAPARGEAQEAYTTPVPWQRDGREAVLVLGADVLTAHAPDTGQELWRWAGYNPRQIDHWRVVASPVVCDDLVIVPGPKHSTLFAVRPGQAAEPGVAWTYGQQVPDASTPLAYQGRLYVLDDDRRTVACLDPASGQAKWQLQLERLDVVRASLLGADGRLYGIDEAGEVFVLAAGDEARLLHRVRLGQDRPCRSSIVAAGHRLFVRTAATLYCLGLAPAR